ncbi:MAG: iron chelate uptake ABC transporter family permease subunit [Phycisphaerales bacterium]
MNTLDLLSGPDLYPAIIAALVISLMGAVLSVFVVLKRLAFIGQGVSHAAFGGVGVALILGFHGATAAGQLAQMSIVVVFSIFAALMIAALMRSQKGRTDTAIGVVLSASMALGFILFAINEARHDHPPAAAIAETQTDHADHADHDHGAQGMQSAHSDEHHVIEEILFGNILDTDWTKALTALFTSAAIMVIVWAIRRRLIFWAFDEPVCDAFGINAKRMTAALLVLLAVAVVMAMQVVGVILAAAALILPGAAALNLSANLRTVFVWSIAIALLGTVLGLMIGFETGYPVGPCIVLVQSAVYLASLLTKWAPRPLRSG